MTDNHHRVLRGVRWRELVSLRLVKAGLPAEPRPHQRKLSAAVADDGPLTDIQGIEQWHLHTVHTSTGTGWGSAVTEAMARAALDGARYCAAIVPRQDDLGGPGVAILPFDVFTDPLKLQQGSTKEAA